MQTNKEFATRACQYKRTYAGKFMLVEGSKILDKISGTDFCVTRKMDGIMLMVIVVDGEVYAYTSHGNNVPHSLPCIMEMKAICAAAGISNATFGAELYATINPNGRERVNDVATAIARPELHDQLHLAMFDIIDMDNQPYEVDHYKEKIKTLGRFFGKGNLVLPVAHCLVQSRNEVDHVFEEWVVEGGFEGLVVHSELPIIYKIKPRHTIDAVVIGYTEGEDQHANMVRDVLLAVMRPDGLLHQFASTGTGFTENQRRDLYESLQSDAVESEYVETDSRNVAFQMVTPRIVVEMSGLDFVTENAAGEPKQNMLLQYDENTGYKPVMLTNGVAVHSPTIVRVREDKTCCEPDISIRQLKDLCSFAIRKAEPMGEVPKSTLLLRKVFVKQSGGKTMVQKYVVWKTNKEHLGNYPAYVFHHTDYSATRLASLKRDLRVSDSETQIMQLCDDCMTLNVKKGWVELS